ncbi:MAG: hypothetical protein R3C28_10840 [Pirellulaceae bacterium]
MYVLDSNTGNFVVYTLPWRGEMASVGAPQAGQLVVLDYGSLANPSWSNSKQRSGDNSRKLKKRDLNSEGVCQ